MFFSGLFKVCLFLPVWIGSGIRGNSGKGGKGGIPATFGLMHMQIWLLLLLLLSLLLQSWI